MSLLLFLFERNETHEISTWHLLLEQNGAHTESNWCLGCCCFFLKVSLVWSNEMRKSHENLVTIDEDNKCPAHSFWLSLSIQIVINRNDNKIAHTNRLFFMKVFKSNNNNNNWDCESQSLLHEQKDPVRQRSLACLQSTHTQHHQHRRRRRPHRHRRQYQRICG